MAEDDLPTGPADPAGRQGGPPGAPPGGQSVAHAEPAGSAPAGAGEPTGPDGPAAGPAVPVPAAARRSRWSRLGGRHLLELFVLTGFAFAQPLLAETGKSPEFFSYRRLSSLGMVWYVLLVTFAPTLILWAVERLVALVSGRAETVLHLLFVAALVGSILIEVGKGGPVPQGYALAVLAGLVAIGLTVLLVRSSTLQLYLRYASPAPIVFALLFVSTSPSGAIVRQAVGGSGPPVLATSVPTASDASGTNVSTGGSTATAPSIAVAPAGVKVPAHPPVVLIFFDEFPLRTLLKPDGTVNAALYPNFAWLSKNTNWFRNATGVSGFTPYAVPAMLRGEYPAKALPPVYSSYKDNILAELSGTYNVSAAETITALCPSSLCTSTSKNVQATGLAPTIKDSGSALKKIVSPFKDKSDPTTEFADSGSAAATNSADSADAKCTSTECLFSALGDDQPSRVKAFVNTLKAPVKGAKPTFQFLHVLLPHGPWHYDSDGRPYPYPAVGPGHADNGGWLDQAWPVQVNLAREMLQLSYADKLLGDVLSKMRAEGTLDKSLLIVTADHGEGFVPGDQARTMDAATAADLSWVPMFLKMPGEVQGKLDERNWTHVDLAATIADVVHVKLPQTLAGQSALLPPRTTTTKYWYNTPGKQLTIPDPVGTYQTVIKGFGGVLGNAKSPADLYKLGPRPDLLGKQVSAVTSGANSSFTLSLNGSVKSAAAAVTPTSAIPTLIYGHLNGKGSGMTVAISVDGVIGAVVPTYADNGAPLSIEALVPPSLWHNGANTITAYVVSGTGAATQLHPIHNS